MKSGPVINELGQCDWCWRNGKPRVDALDKNKWNLTDEYFEEVIIEND